MEAYTGTARRTKTIDVQEDHVKHANQTTHTEHQAKEVHEEANKPNQSWAVHVRQSEDPEDHKDYIQSLERKRRCQQ